VVDPDQINAGLPISYERDGKVQAALMPNVIGYANSNFGIKSPAVDSILRSYVLRR